ncbi:hypothetical protein CAPTEDRAFT_155089 [Capitella teleta]|uniref:Corticotropin-releasing factor-binding protein n=1 Tax=Capitella teleta TaxID=283909 RepID=X1Z7A5_CAPTE|nr:hypothetical protein CAPTEDRAFT_155089 [Capitella teleta]|eukprot:ELU04690.1 hypothetical protein CAPTEDRAFT_155089 [Capitella teleta]
MESFDGDYWYRSPGDQGGAVCGLFVIAHPEQLIQITFNKFDIDCESGGLLAMVDGWETQGQFFPSDEDHQLPFEMRYQTYCGGEAPTVFISSQNVALIQYRIPTVEEGFHISVRMIDNPEPCNVVTMIDHGVMSISNHGHRRNCSVSIMYPENIKLLNVDVGKTHHIPTQVWKNGLTRHCKKRMRDDYVELLTGPGLDSSLMKSIQDFCGLSSRPGAAMVPLACGHAVVRLVSSGNYYNSVTFGFEGLTDDVYVQYATKQCMD